MGAPDIELNPEYVRSMLLVLQEFGIEKFKCSLFSVTFPQPDEPEKSASESTPAIGFEAKGNEDRDEDAEDDKAASLFKRALGLRGHMPTLSPVVEPPDDKD